MIARRRRLLSALALLSIPFTWDGLAAPAQSGEPLMVNQIVAHPKHPDLLVAAARPQGALKSTDGGRSWRPARTGLKNTSAFHLAVAGTDPRIFYLATFGGGVYRSDDGAESWKEMNTGLGNTNIHALAVDPSDADRVVVATSTGELFSSNDGGRQWTAANRGVTTAQPDVAAAFRFDRSDPPHLYLGLERLYLREPGGGWFSKGNALASEIITTLTLDPVDRLLYAGTRNDGLFVSNDRGGQWRPVTGPFRKKTIQLVAFDGAQPPGLYASVITQGLMKSTNRGATWQPLTEGLPPDEDVLSLAIDPRDARRLWAGMRSSGIFLSSDGGASWKAAMIAQEPVTAIVESLAAQPSATRETAARPPVPASFEKCTKCHGWTDPYLTQKRTFWRVPPNSRNWDTTVARMSVGNNVTPAEQEEIARFLNNYSRVKTGDDARTGGSTSPP